MHRASHVAQKNKQYKKVKKLLPDHSKVAELEATASRRE